MRVILLFRSRFRSKEPAESCAEIFPCSTAAKYLCFSLIWARQIQLLAEPQGWLVRCAQWAHRVLKDTCTSLVFGGNKATGN